MNWEAIGVVVIVSVVYLALQMRNSNQLAEASTERAWTHGLNEIWGRWLQMQGRVAGVQQRFLRDEEHDAI